jgi:hypothetical protein
MSIFLALSISYTIPLVLLLFQGSWENAAFRPHYRIMRLQHNSVRQLTQENSGGHADVGKDLGMGDEIADQAPLIGLMGRVRCAFPDRGGKTRPAKEGGHRAPKEAGAQQRVDYTILLSQEQSFFQKAK